VHGDFSPKNILIDRPRMVVLDCEVACTATQYSMWLSCSIIYFSKRFTTLHTG
jgi:hypothetical protein